MDTHATNESKRMQLLRAAYRAAKADLIARNKGKCEGCGAPARYPHHIMPVGKTGIHDIMAVEPANLILLCDHCHTLMHPNCRQYLWKKSRINRANAMR